MHDIVLAHWPVLTVVALLIFWVGATFGGAAVAIVASGKIQRLETERAPVNVPLTWSAATLGDPLADLTYGDDCDRQRRPACAGRADRFRHRAPRNRVHVVTSRGRTRWGPIRGR